MLHQIDKAEMSEMTLLGGGFSLRNIFPMRLNKPPLTQWLTTQTHRFRILEVRNLKLVSSAVL